MHFLAWGGPLAAYGAQKNRKGSNHAGFRGWVGLPGGVGRLLSRRLGRSAAELPIRNLAAVLNRLSHWVTIFIGQSVI